MKKLSIIICMCVMSASLLFSGGQKEETEKEPQKKMTLIVWDWHSPRMNLLEPKLKEYEKENPNVEFETMIIAGGDYWKKLLSGIMAKKAPVDILQFGNSKTTEFVNFLEPYPENMFPLEKMREEYVAFDPGFLVNGKMYFFPLGIMSSLIYYNVDMWNNAGLGAKPKTWDELRQVAKQLTKREDGTLQVEGFGFAGAGYMQYIWEDIKYQLGGWLYNKDGTAADDSWVESPGVDALNLLKDLIFKDRVTDPGFLGFTESFGTEKAAMVYAWTWFTGFLNTNYPDLKYDVFALPTMTGSPLPAIARNNWEVQYAVLKLVPDEKKQEVFKFLRWLYDDDSYQIRLNQELGTVPGKISLWDDPEIKNHPVLSVLSNEIPYTVFPGERPSYVNSIQNNIDTRIFEGMSAIETLQITKKEVDEILKEKPVKWSVERQYKPGGK